MLDKIAVDIAALFQIQGQAVLERLRTEPRGQEPLRVIRHGFKAFSQGDEDGILQEILARIGIASRTFVEFGVEDGRECNSLFLLAQGWSGLWMEGAPAMAQGGRERLSHFIESGHLEIREVLVGPGNIDTLLTSFADRREISHDQLDVLSIDIDYNDYWVWEAVENASPRVVVIEYNAVYPPPVRFSVPHDPDGWWDGTSHYGASLQALTDLGTQKNYSLVACSLTGVNAFFVRNDLLNGPAGPRFYAPGSAEAHFEPARFDLVRLRAGHAPRLGPNAFAASPEAEPSFGSMISLTDKQT